MSVTVSFACDGCEAKTDPIPAKCRFESFNGRGYGFGVNRTDQIEHLAPEGWVAFDPYTHATYCQICWDGIIAATTPEGE